jgi:hypothetical protein
LFSEARTSELEGDLDEIESQVWGHPDVPSARLVVFEQALCLEMREDQGRDHTVDFTSFAV